MKLTNVSTGSVQSMEWFCYKITHNHLILKGIYKIALFYNPLILKDFFDLCNKAQWNYTNPNKYLL